MAEVTPHDDEIDGRPVHWREADGAPVLYIHGVPTSGGDWEPFLARTGGWAPDLPGFGRSGKRGDGDYTLTGLGGWVGRFADHVGAERVRLVVHDFGGCALQWATAEPHRIERLVVVNAAPLLPGYRWHRIARIWRRRGLGELAMGFMGPRVLRRIGAEATTQPALPEELVGRILEGWDQGTQRAILQLYRSAPEEALARAGEGLGRLTCPALVVWGDADPYIPPRFADAYAAALGTTAPEVLHLPDAGHWPWIDRPDVVDSVAAFVTA